MYYPLNYEQINLVEGTRLPSTHYTRNTVAFDYWVRSLYQRACSVMNFKIPFIGTEKAFFQWCLLIYGNAVFFNKEEYGFIFQPAGLSGYNLYYAPAKAIVTNPAFTESIEMTIGKECELLTLSPDCKGIADIIDFYAGQLAELSTAVNVAEINAKMPDLVSARDKASAETFKKVIDKINIGESSVIFSEKFLSAERDKEPKIQPMKLVENRKNNYMLGDLLQDFQSIVNNFDSEIGIPTVPYQKKERMVSFESQSRLSDCSARCRTWIDHMNSCFEKINEKFGTDMSVEYAYKEVSENVNHTPNSDRNVQL